MNRLINYLRDTRAELQHVRFPTQKQALTYTALVVLISLITAFALGFFDYLFARILDTFVLN